MKTDLQTMGERAQKLADEHQCDLWIFKYTESPDSYIYRFGGFSETAQDRDLYEFSHKVHPSN